MAKLEDSQKTEISKDHVHDEKTVKPNFKSSMHANHNIFFFRFINHNIDIFFLRILLCLIIDNTQDQIVQVFNRIPHNSFNDTFFAFQVASKI